MFGQTKDRYACGNLELKLCTTLARNQFLPLNNSFNWVKFIAKIAPTDTREGEIWRPWIKAGIIVEKRGKILKVEHDLS